MSNPAPKKTFYLQWFVLNGISLLPLQVLYKFADALFVIFYYVLRYRRKVVQQNLRRSFPEKDEHELARIEKQFYRNLCDIMVETVKLGYISEADLQNRVKIRNLEVMQPFFDRKSPVISLSSHMGNWEWAITGACVNIPYPVDGIYKPLKNRFFEAYMRRLRSRFGARLVPMQDTLRDFIRMKN
ncbi:MAG: lauroyl acyltransferase, partial [Hymenobacteraceae bacterium]|nr:lauroyl acyltransferase [Hymenobacteraceae bacterium]MDX5395511.1 lauroyl acyltransferase [Hymenobacteraceae bacterium]MDX5511565.1 lauroyl acyltransferase [Hymenobacteraceae bacterium]